MNQKKSITYTALLGEFRQKSGNLSFSASKNALLLVVCLLQDRTVSLYTLRTSVGRILNLETYNLESHYKRLTRFFVQHKDSSLWQQLLSLAFSFLPADEEASPTGYRMLYLDGTEWCIGKTSIHLLTIGLHFRGVAIPLYFSVLHHKGVLSVSDRIDFLKEFSTHAVAQKAILVADREFIGDDWFDAIDTLGLSFVIRLRKRQYRNSLKFGRLYTVLEARALRKGRASALVTIKKRTYRLWVIKNLRKEANEPLVYLLTNLNDERLAADFYRLRWKIETCFKHLKTNGFNLEDLRFTDTNKIRLLFAIATVAYAIALYHDILESKKNPQNDPMEDIIHYQNGTRYRRISAFKLGLQLAKQQVTTLDELLTLWTHKTNTPISIFKNVQ